MSLEASPARDFVGYGDSPPDFEWPTGARLALNFVINYEEGAERNPLDGYPDRETLVEYRYDVAPGERELFEESTYEFGSRVGIWRLLHMLDDFAIIPTIFGCAVAFLRNPAAVEAFAARGCDIVGHGYRWIPHAGLSLDEERAEIRRASDVFCELTGQRIKGWFNRPPQTVNTRRALALEGLLYDSGAVNDDIPYFDSIDARPFLVVPYSLDINDVRFWKGQFFTGDHFAKYAIASFDVLRAESLRRTPRMMSVGLHPRIVGRPGRLAGLARFLDHVRGHDDVWVTGRNQIAEFWADSYAPPGTWNWQERPAV
jgi:allantoinase